ncbi:MAG: DUF1598 domain-containing protein, partial [Planctomycetes bacterium]|nr:DUF1598 domain-containing protein [Planctomycetota bacterium]
MTRKINTIREAGRDRGGYRRVAWLVVFFISLSACCTVPRSETLGVQSSEVSTSPQPQVPSSVPVDPGERVCLSLRVLAQVVSKHFAEGTPLPASCRALAGIGFLEGFIVDDAGDGDVILVGRRSESRPSLRLDDLIANMRSIGQRHGDPYCSLDPQPESVRALQALISEVQRQRGPTELAVFFTRLKATVGPQQVVIGGVPRDSRHAHVMINADYHMKKVSQGHVTLPGVTSYLDRALESARAELSKGTLPVIGASLARFWFHVAQDSPTFKYKEGKGDIWLKKCRVVVLTEKQVATASGDLHDVTEDDPLAQAFANDLSEALAGRRVIVSEYADLENLFRLRALLLAMQNRGSLGVLRHDFNSYIAG